jgi:Mg/Co/Ni transporter MgtE
MFFKRIRIDPAVATGPFVTTAIDVIGILLTFYWRKFFSLENWCRHQEIVIPHRR